MIFRGIGERLEGLLEGRRRLTERGTKPSIS